MTERERTISLTKLDEKVVLRVVAISPVVTTKALMDTITKARAYTKEYKK